MARPDTDVLINPFREAIAGGRPLIGAWSMLNSTNAIEGLAWAGFDWILIDGEHAPVTLADAMAHLRAMGGSPTLPIVRLAWNDPVLLKRYLDAGATTIMLPFVQDAEEARRAVRGMRYPPQGERGVAVMHRASRYGHLRDYVQRANDSLYLIVQIETRAALSELEAICAVDGVDAVFFGPGDLAASMDMPGQAGHPTVTAAIEDGLATVRASGKAAGVLAPNAEIAERHLRAGFDFVSVANDCVMLFATADTTAAHFRQMAAARPVRAAG